jgi:hypothetical protein
MFIKRTEPASATAGALQVKCPGYEVVKVEHFTTVAAMFNWWCILVHVGLNEPQKPVCEHVWSPIPPCNNATQYIQIGREVTNF